MDARLEPGSTDTPGRRALAGGGPAGVPPPDGAPAVPFTRFSALWIQLTGTWCNLSCTHCLNASGPRDPWLRPMPADQVRRHVTAAARLGVREIYFTGGEPFLHPQALELLAFSLAAAPTTVLTNGTRIDAATAEALAALAASSRYSLEVRVSLDDPDPARNDRIRGRGAFARAVGAIARLDARGLLPIVTASEISGPDRPGTPSLYDRLRDLLRSLGVRRPRVKILPVFPVGRMAGTGAAPLTPGMLDGYDASTLPCADSRAVAEGGVYACPILAGLPGARLSDGDLAAAFVPARLTHPACATCVATGASCRN